MEWHTPIIARYFYAQHFSEDIHATNSIELVHATAQSPIIYKNTTLVHKQRIISANPNPILKQIADL